MKKLLLIVTLFFLIQIPSPKHAKADFWGGDLIILSKILSNAILQYEKLKSITEFGKGTYRELKEINEGIKKALHLKESLNYKLRPGMLSDLTNIKDIILKLEQVYGKIPKTIFAKTQIANDLAVAESIKLHNDAFKYADQMDPIAEQLKSYGKKANQKNAIRASVQAQGLMINVLNQILRTNAALLKMQSNTLALTNYRSKIKSKYFNTIYKIKEDQRLNNKNQKLTSLF